MRKRKGISWETLQKAEERYMLPLMAVAWIPALFLVKDSVSGLFSGVASAFFFLLLEGSAYFLKNYLDRVLQTVSYLILLFAFSGIMGILLHGFLFTRTDVLLPLCILEQASSVYILRKLVRTEKTETAEKKEDGEEEQEKKEEKEEKKAAEGGKKLLACFEAAVEYLLFLLVFGLLREYVGKWIVPVRLLSGGFLLTAALLFLWKLTKTMPERFGKLPRMVFCAGLILLVLTGFLGLL